MLWTKHISTKSSYQRCQNPSSIVGFKTFVIIESCEKVTIKIEQVVMELVSGIWDFGIQVTLAIKYVAGNSSFRRLYVQIPF